MYILTAVPTIMLTVVNASPPPSYSFVCLSPLDTDFSGYDCITTASYFNVSKKYGGASVSR